MHWDEVKPIDRQDAEVALATEDDEVVCDALVRCTFHENDWKWVQSQCLRLLQSPAITVRIVAVTCLGHLARIHGVLDLDRVLPVLSELAKDSRIAGRVEDTLDDIRLFVAQRSGE